MTAAAPMGDIAIGDMSLRLEGAAPSLAFEDVSLRAPGGAVRACPTYPPGDQTRGRKWFLHADSL